LADLILGTSVLGLTASRVEAGPPLQLAPGYSEREG
jgi:hypothetical protein